MLFNTFLNELGLLVVSILIIASVVYVLKKIKIFFFNPNEEAEKKLEVNYGVISWALLILSLIIIKLLEFS
ncbi:hypothetical protein [Vagococcus fluvialis]|uniref:Uncharacterized protein n=1 Tax=Vagococcus fluvialis TaxID=2738 RepID=A0A7X6D9W5_9ENTE|nr:hypothetical protein [Vagococcus fluvialis]NKC68491.1 hypothetical protein [Vagococcus fluvialis]